MNLDDVDIKDIDCLTNETKVDFINECNFTDDYTNALNRLNPSNETQQNYLRFLTNIICIALKGYARSNGSKINSTERVSYAEILFEAQNLFELKNFEE